MALYIAIGHENMNKDIFEEYLSQVEVTSDQEEHIDHADHADHTDHYETV